ncbi:stage III sporulation protein AF [Ammoniphilus oxalaticus]|uniref:Stage III sporulation protein AF n=1 Tax=Ammoniphilus oxalaticus TaxID=66863 RepID=A0A419SMQ3_9BACL|nr:stage III sporulation protein AF [Ammoniphilus oxalaticus]RKD25574.1 stage III sporulation protein AF [Ammoniphilus oxalaticus]
MIEAISHWLQEIILLVLIATILDMLLPSTSIQRYVKFVMALLILLSMISPVIHWFQKDLSLEKIYLRILNYNEDAEQDWAHLKQYSEQLMRDHEQETTGFVKSQLESLITAKVEEQHGMKVDFVKIEIEQKSSGEQSYPVISSVQLILDKDIRDKGHGEDEDRIQIQPVEPVTIDVGGETTTPVSSLVELSAAERKTLEDIATDIAQTWSIDRSKVTTKLKGNQEEG